MAIVKQPTINEVHLESICNLIADTNEGLTGTEIGRILQVSEIIDIDPTNKKSNRLFNAFANYQNRNQCSNNILNFLCRAMSPTRYFGNEEIRINRLNELNKRLSFIGIEVSEAAKLRKVAQATTLNEAQQRASNFKSKLLLRNVHPEVIKYCNEELLQQNYFHAVFEGVKSVAQRLRNFTGVHADGNPLADLVFSTDRPLLRINPLQDANHRSEHLGLSNMIKGLFGLIRNPTAHTPKILFIIDEQEALDVMSIVSYVHKKLDGAF